MDPDSNGRKSTRLTTLILILDAIVLASLGVLFLGFCGGGVSVIIFAAAVGVMGAVLGRSGAWALLLPTGMIVLVLIAAGLLIAGEAGCLP